MTTIVTGKRTISVPTSDSRSGTWTRGEAEEVQDGEPEERPGHEDAEVGEVDQLDDAVDHREAKRQSAYIIPSASPLTTCCSRTSHHSGGAPGPAGGPPGPAAAQPDFSGATPMYMNSPSRHW